MNHRATASHRATAAALPQRATNVTPPQPLLKEARPLSVNLRQACERGLVEAVAAGGRACWLAENQDAIEAWNTHVETHGLPLAGYRRF